MQHTGPQVLVKSKFAHAGSGSDVRMGKLISRDYQIRSTETVQFFDYLCMNFEIFVFCKQQGKCAELVYCQNFRGNEKWIF